MTSPPEPSSGEDDITLMPEEQAILVESLKRVQRQDVLSRRRRILDELDAAPFCAITLSDRNNSVNALLRCYRTPETAFEVELTLPGRHGQQQTVNGRLTCLGRVERASDSASSDSKSWPTVLSCASPDEPVSANLLDESFELPAEVNFKLQLDEIPEGVKLTAGEVRKLPVSESVLSEETGVWPYLSQIVPLSPYNNTASTERPTVLALESNGESPFITVDTDDVRVELFDNADLKTTFANSDSVPFVADLTCQTIDGVEQFSYVIDPSSGEISNQGTVVKTSVWTPDGVNSPEVKLSVRPLASHDSCFLNQEQRHRWLGDEPVAALTVRATGDGGFHLTTFGYDMSAIIADRNSVLVVRRLLEGGVA